jgi:hypothetical protein
MAEATQGRRNDALHWCACRLGVMLAARELHDAQRAADVLAQVAATTGLPDHEIRATIRSGLDTYGVHL